MIAIRAFVATAAGTGLIFSSCSFAQPAKRADDPAIASRLVGDVAACRAITADAERLACFDRTVAAFETARAGNQLRVVDREDIKKTRRTLFGLSIPRLNLFGGGENDEPEIKEIDATIRSVREVPHGLWIVGLDDGSQWQFTEQVTREPKVGDPINIKRGALGSYFGTVKKWAALKMKRIG